MPPSRRRKSSECQKRPEKKQRTEEAYSVDCLFCELLEKHGFILSAGDSKNQIKVDQEVLQRNLTNSLKLLGRMDESVDEFLDGFSNYIDEPPRFSKSLMPTTTTAYCETARSTMQESLVRILLGIDIVQPKLINLLLEKLPEFIGDDDNVIEQGEKINVPRLLLNQFRWLGRIVRSRDLTMKLLEMIAVTSLDVQKEIISALPEVVEDSEHGEVANTLKQLLLDSNQLTVIILDALSNLNLSKDLLAEVQSSALRTLNSVNVEDLPVVVNFLMQTVTTQDALEVVSELRANLDFDTFVSTSNKASKKLGKSGGSSNSVADCKVLTVDAIKMGICSMKSVAEAWMKTIEAVKSSKDHKVIDLVALLILHNVSRKPSESLFRNKIRAGAFSEVLLKSTLGNHTEMLREYFQSILSLGESFLRSPEPAIVHFARSMFRYAFFSFDSFCRQEMVGTLVTQASSGQEGEVDAALDILMELVQQRLTSMAPYTIFIKGILDCLDKLTMTQIRKLYSMLSQLAFLQPEHGSAVQDDLFIIIRKQLSSDSPKYRRMGVIGAIMVVKSLAFVRGSGSGDADGATCSRETPSASSSRMNEEMYKQVISLLQMVNSSSSHVPEAAALFMDELSAVVAQGQLHPQVLQWISDNMTSDFQDEFVFDFEGEKAPECSLLPMAQLYNLNTDVDSFIAINLLPLVAEAAKKKSKLLPFRKGKSEKVTDPTYMAPLFRLVQVCEYQQNKGDLEGIDALLGCPVYAVDEKAFDKVESLSTKEREAACTVLFHILNWFREVVNGFATQDDVEMKGKVILRLQNITHLQAILEKCLATVPGYCPPPANFDLDNSLKAPVLPALSGSGEKKRGRKGKKKAKENAEPTEVEEEDDNSRSQMEKGSQQQSQTQKSSQVKQNSAEKKFAPTVDLTNYQQFFRELDVGVFTVLSSGLITKADLDTNMNTRATEELQIQPPQLKFLLDDLIRKMNHSLLASAGKRRTFLKAKVEKNVGFSHLDRLTPTEFATKVVEFLPSLCDHLEGTSAFFQALTTNTDESDDPDAHTPEAEMMKSCFDQLLHILHSLFSWNGFSSSDNTPLFKKALSVLVKRIKATDATQPSLQDLLRGAFRYIQNFSETSPSLQTAVTLMKLLVCLHEKLGEKEEQKKLADLARQFLKREWVGPNGEPLRGAKHHDNLFPMIRTFLLCSKDTMAAVESLAVKAIPQLLEADKDGCSESFPSLTRPAFAVFYRVLFAELVEIVKGIQVGKQRESTEAKLDKLLRWSTAIRVLHVLVGVVKTLDARAHLTCCLKYGRQFVEAFLRQGMPLLDQIFHSHQNDVHGLLRNLQLSTRGLHHLCGHSKIVRDTVLTNQVPELKRVLEMLVYRVKAMLTVNGCREAFWMGNLKNRDLHGEEILSQANTTSQQQSSEVEEEEEEEEEEALADSSESEVEMDDQSEAGDNGREENSRGDRESLSQVI